jgi:hypothetical protein
MALSTDRLHFEILDLRHQAKARFHNSTSWKRASAMMRL